MAKKKKNKKLFGRNGLLRGMTFQNVRQAPYAEVKSALNFSKHRKVN